MSKANLFERLQKLKESNNNDFYEKACTEAYNHILKDHEVLMEAAARNKWDRAYLYRWNYEPDPRSKKFRFNGVRISDIVKHGNLIERLNKFFKDINSQFYVSSHPFKKEKGDKRNTEYGIYVSWAEPHKYKDSDTKSSEYSDTTDISKKKLSSNDESEDGSDSEVEIEVA